MSQHQLYLNGNYYYGKFKRFAWQKKNFIWIISIVIFLINYDLAHHFFNFDPSVYIDHKTLDTVKKGPFPQLNPINLYNKKSLPIIYLSYWVISFFAARLYALWFFEFFLRDKVFKFDPVKESEVLVPPFPYDQDKLQLIIGIKHDEDTTDLVENPKWIIIPEKGMHQDFLIIGGKGTGKTAGCMYPFTKQMIYYKSYDQQEKAGMLILDVKGNYTKEALKCANDVNRQNDVIVINLSGKYRYNPLHKPTLKTQVIANRLRTVLELFSTQHADSYWLDKAEVLLNEAIKLVRLYNKGYVTFVEIHRVVNNDEYLNEKIEALQELEDRNKLTREQKADFRTVKDYFLSEYKTLDTKISSVIKSEVTRMTYTFVSDTQILNAFCAPEDKLNFFGFDELVDKGKIVVLDMNIAEFRNLSKIIAAYLKLDFQAAALIRLTRENANKNRPLIFISDEYQEYVTASDADFYAVSREAKCVSIVSTQSYSSLLKTLKSEETLQTILTNLTNKIWLRTDDKKTAESAVAQCGVVDREDVSKTLSESAKMSHKNLLGRTGKEGANWTEGLNVSFKTTEKFKITFFTVKLPIFTAISYLSDGTNIMPPTVIHLEPYFKDIYTNLKGRPALNIKETSNEEYRPEIKAEDIIEIEDNFDFESNKVKDAEKPEKLEEQMFDFDDDKKEEISKDKIEKIEEDDFGFDDYEAPRPKKEDKEKKEEFVPKYLDKEVEENLKGIEGVFDED